MLYQKPKGTVDDLKDGITPVKSCGGDEVAVIAVIPCMYHSFLVLITAAENHREKLQIGSKKDGITD